MGGTSALNILIATSKEHIKYYAVMLESLFANHQEDSIDVYVIHSNLASIDWTTLNDQARRYGNRIMPIPVDEQKFEAFPKISNKWPSFLYYKLLAAELLPANLDRVLLLESDMLITKSLSPLYNMPFDGNHIIACRNMPQYWGTFGEVQSQDRLKQNLSIPSEYELFGGGVIVYNLEKCREEQLTYEKLVQLGEKFRYAWASPEESLFWALYYKSRKEADPWSYYLMPCYWQAEQGNIADRSDPYGSIIHYVLSNKPWDSYVLDTESELDRLWWSVAERTPYYNEMRERYDNRLADRRDVVEAKTTLGNLYLYHQTLIRWKYIQDTVGQNALEQYFSEKGISSIAVYGINALQVLLCTEMSRTSTIKVPYLVDSYESRRKGEYLIRRVSDCSFHDVDAIVIAAFLHKEAIMNNIEHATCPVLSLHSIIEELLPDSFNEHLS